MSGRYKFPDGTKIRINQGFNEIYIRESNLSLPLPKDSPGFVISIAISFSGAVYWVKFDCLPCPIKCDEQFLVVDYVSMEHETALKLAIEQLQVG
jgi:hypothetical protein